MYKPPSCSSAVCLLQGLFKTSSAYFMHFINAKSREYSFLIKIERLNWRLLPAGFLTWIPLKQLISPDIFIFIFFLALSGPCHLKASVTH